MKKHLIFKSCHSVIGTFLSQYNIYNLDDELLGILWYNTKWKCFVWEQENGIIMSVSCLLELTEFMSKLKSQKRLFSDIKKGKKL
jgi:hypothetical protein